MNNNNFNQSEIEYTIFSTQPKTEELEYAIKNLRQLTECQFQVKIIPLFQTPYFFETCYLIEDYLFEQSFSQDTIENLKEEIQRLVLSIFYTSTVTKEVSKIITPFVPLELIDCVIKSFMKGSPQLRERISFIHTVEIAQLIHKEQIPWHIVYQPIL